MIRLSTKHAQSIESKYEGVLITWPLAIHDDSLSYIYTHARYTIHAFEFTSVHRSPVCGRMGKDLAMIHTSYKTWLCNAALFALICAAFGAGVLLGPIVTARGKDELTRNLHCSPDGDKASQFASNPQRRLKSECISRGQLKDFMKQWSRTLGDLIEGKMLNATKRKLNHAIRKFSKNKDVQTQRTMEGKIKFCFF